MSYTDLGINSELLNFLSRQEKWKKFNSIQEKTIPHILNKTNSLIIAPTASGKTEAALIPIFSELISKKSTPVSVIYVAPLKALINDLYLRINRWCEYFNLTAMKWHGDVNYSKRNSFIKNPTDFLFITPESLEVILLNQPEEIKKELFGNLEYFIIDEIHYFANSDRGTQLNSLVNRISEYSSNKITKIGLSATVGNPKTIADWIDNKNPVKIIEEDNDKIFQYKVWDKNIDELTRSLEKYLDKKILIFVNSRALAEKYYNHFKSKINIVNLFIHHSSIDSETREKNEQLFKKLDSAFMISTNTLELGIDIGSIDVVIQLEPPFDMSSFSQRIGRCGRRNNRQRTIINTHYINLIVTLAELKLKQENKIEDIFISNKSKDILFHQILSYIFQFKQVKPKEVYDNLTNCYVFSNVSKNEFKRMLSVMKQDKFIYSDGPYLSLDLNFEKTFGRKNFMEFYSVFMPNYEFSVKKGRSEVGKLDASFVMILSKDDDFYLGGKKWTVKSINKQNFIVQVVESSFSKADIPRWNSGGSPLSYLISRKTYNVLLGEYNGEDIKTFDDNALNNLKYATESSLKAGFLKNHIPVEFINKKKSKKVYIYTFAGNKVNTLLSTLFKLHYPITSQKVSPFYISFNINNDFSIEDIHSIMSNIDNILTEKDMDARLSETIGKFTKNKFIKYLAKEDEIELKNEILFDKENLIRLCHENELCLAYDFKLKDWL